MPSEESQSPPRAERKCPLAAAAASRNLAVPAAVAPPANTSRPYQKHTAAGSEAESALANSPDLCSASVDSTVANPHECTVQAVVEHHLPRRARRARAALRRRPDRRPDDLRADALLLADAGPDRSAGAVRPPPPRRRRGHRLPLLPLP